MCWKARQQTGYCRGCIGSRQRNADRWCSCCIRRFNARCDKDNTIAIQGMTQDAVLLTGNIFGPAPSFSSYFGAAVFAAPKAKLYNSLDFTSAVFMTPTASGVLTPPIVQDSNAHNTIWP